MNERLKEFYKRHPDLFIEQLGIKLHLYQKVLLRTIYKRKYVDFIERYYVLVEYLKNNKRGRELE